MRSLPRLSRAGLAVLAVAVSTSLVPAAAGAHGKARDTCSKQPSGVAVVGGATSLALDAGAVAALGSLGIAASPIGPATAQEDGSLSFPITGGTLQPAALTGSISHSGGILLAKGSTKVALKRFEIVLDDTPALSAKVGGARVEILSLDLSGLTVEQGEDGSLELGGVVTRLTAAAAGALNGAFGTDAFAEGLVLGTATVRAQLG